MTKTEAQRKRKFLEWLKKTEAYAENQPLMVIDYVFQAFGNYTNDGEIKIVLDRIRKAIKENLNARRNAHKGG